jgi:hypothetical protein
LALSQGFLLINTALRSFICALVVLEFLPTSITGKLAGEGNRKRLSGTAKNRKFGGWENDEKS